MGVHIFPMIPGFCAMWTSQNLEHLKSAWEEILLICFLLNSCCSLVVSGSKLAYCI